MEMIEMILKMIIKRSKPNESPVLWEDGHSSSARGSNSKTVKWMRQENRIHFAKSIYSQTKK